MTPAAEKYTGFIERLTLTKDTKSGRAEPFRLLPYNRELIEKVFGTLNEDGTRQFRTVFFSVARKNAKTQVAAGIVLAMLCLSADEEIYSAAKSADQSEFVYKAAAAMVRASPALSALITCVDYRKELVHRNGNTFRSISAEGASKFGGNPSAVILDELAHWGMAEAALYDALTSGSIARRQPLTIIITTAGSGGAESLGGRQYAYACKVRDGIITDPTYLPLIFEVPQDADWRDETQWVKANPSLGTIVRIESLREACEKAKAMPSEEVKFRRYNLNQWLSSEKAWIPGPRWDACAREVDIEDLQRRRVPCYGGLDLGSVADLSALVLAWPIGDQVLVYPDFFIPNELVDIYSKRDGVDYSRWVRDGLVEVTPGNVTDWRFVAGYIDKLASNFNIRKIGFDPANAGTLVAAEINETHEDLCISQRQGFLDLNSAIKETERLILSKNLIHSGHAVLKWNIACSTVATDHNGNLKIVKPDVRASSSRIDGALAMVMAVGLARSIRPKRKSILTQEGWEAAGRTGTPGILHL